MNNSPGTSLRIEPIRATAKLPAAAWRAIASAEHLQAATVGDHDRIVPVSIDDGGQVVVVLTAHAWERLTWRLDELERSQP